MDTSPEIDGLQCLFGKTFFKRLRTINVTTVNPFLLVGLYGLETLTIAKCLIRTENKTLYYAYFGSSVILFNYVLVEVKVVTSGSSNIGISVTWSLTLTKL